MDKSTFSAAYEILRVRLVALREHAGLTQRQLAERLGRERSFVARVELGERRVDLVEFHWICRACGCAAADQGRYLLELFAQADGTGRSRAKARREAGDFERLLAAAREPLAPYRTDDRGVPIP